jgi:hypothetical protein
MYVAISSKVIPVSSMVASIPSSRFRDAIDMARSDNAAFFGDGHGLDSAVRVEAGNNGAIGGMETFARGLPHSLSSAVRPFGGSANDRNADMGDRGELKKMSFVSPGRG